LSSVEPHRARASGLASPTLLPASTAPNRGMAPAANNRASARLVLPVPPGPTIAIALVPWAVPSISLSSSLPVSLFGRPCAESGGSTYVCGDARSLNAETLIAKHRAVMLRPDRSLSKRPQSLHERAETCFAFFLAISGNRPALCHLRAAWPGRGGNEGASNPSNGSRQASISSRRRYQRRSDG